MERGPGVPHGQFVHELVGAWYEREPDATALVDDSGELTYRELETRPNQLAGHLGALGVGPERIVATCFDRSAEMVVAMLAVLKAGGVYLPLDPAYPTPRLELMLLDSGAGLLLTQSRLRGRVPAFDGRVLSLDAARDEIGRLPDRRPAVAPAPDALA